MKTLTPQILGMYIGCECQYTDDEGDTVSAILMGWHGKNKMAHTHDAGGYGLVKLEGEGFKLLLRPLSDMTEEEFKQSGLFDSALLDIGISDEKEQLLMFVRESRAKEDRCWYPDTYVYLLSKSFDLFNLIESGLAINAALDAKEVGG
jgi:hypothetical protein